MWVFVLFVISVIGFVQTKKDPLFQYKVKKSSGWQTYYLVAEQGLLVFLKVLLAIFFFYNIIVFPIFLLMKFLENIEITNLNWLNQIGEMISKPGALGLHWFEEYIAGGKNLFVTLFHKDNRDITIGAILIYGLLYALGDSSKSKEETPEVDVMKEIAKESAVESLLLKAMLSGSLILVTLKSRKVYVGQLRPRNSTLAGDHILLIPILSGHRDKDTLMFRVDHDYSAIYASLSHNEKAEKEKVKQQFQQILFIEEIESISLFNSEIYKNFQEMHRGCSSEEHF